MTISQTPEVELFPYRATDQFEDPVQRYSPIPTACDIKDGKLFGIPLKSALTNETLKDSVIEKYIASAISELEHSLDMYITPVKFREQHDYDRHSFSWSYNYTKLDHPNVLNVSSVQLSFSNNVTQPGFVDFPLEFVYVRPQEGVIQLVPAFGTSTSGFLLSAFSGVQFHALRAIGMNHFPGGVRIEYTVGFAKDRVPAAICQLIEILAAINVLSTMSPILFPQTSISIGIDGVSQSTGGFGPKFLSDRIQQLTQERDRLLDVVRGYYQRKFIVGEI